MDNGRAYLNLLRGQTRKVAEMLWFDDKQMTWDAIANDLSIGYTSVHRERDRAIEAVALYLKRVEYRKVRMSWA